jgi:hypothetical protein
MRENSPGLEIKKRAEKQNIEETYNINTSIIRIRKLRSQYGCRKWKPTQFGLAP